MEKVYRIPGTELEVSRVGFGTANAGLAWQGEDSFRILEGYLRLGGNLIDTARVYSDWVKPEVGRSERVLGEWMRHRGHRDDFVLMTKCGHPEMETMTVSRMSRAEIEGDLDLSLKALSIDQIDIYCYHRDDPHRPVDELIETMENFVRSGKIKHYACSNWSTHRMVQADNYCKERGYRGFILNQALYNYGTAQMKPFPDKTMVTVDDEMLEYHAKNLNNVLAPYMGLSSGFFHALATKGEEAVKESPYFTPANLELHKKIAAIAKQYDTGSTQVLLGFLLTRKPEMIALVGASRMEQMEAAMNTFDVEFDGEAF